MSGIRSAAWGRIPPLIGAALLLLTGCRSVPSTPTGHDVRPADARDSANHYDDDSQDGGFSLWPRRKPSPALPSAGAIAPGVSSASPASPSQDGGVQQASLVQPIPPVENLNRDAPVPVLNADDYDDGRVPDNIKDPPSKWSPEGMVVGFKSMIGMGPNRDLAKQHFDEGKALMQAKQYKAAAGKFKEAAGRWPDSLLEENAMFLQAECLFFADEYAKSFDTFTVLLKKHDNTRHMDTVSRRLFDIARFWEKTHQVSPHWALTPNLSDSTRPRFDTNGGARKAYELIAMHDPTGPLADDALMALANNHFLNKHYEEAASYYERLRKEYPKSPHQVQAHLLGMKSQELVYQGSDYDRKPLDEATKIAEETLLQFGPELGKERENVEKTRDRLAAKRADRDWQMAQFYETKRAYGAARFYYNEILKEYPSTEMARQAEQRLAQIKDYPAKPPNRFKLLTDIFPDK